ncbi:MAG TPA: lipoprotein [Gallionella sp.]|nr:lipoprotein [Gallionella sp.]
MRLKLTLAIIVALILSLQGCGKKGPLKLPAAQSFAASQTTFFTDYRS